MWSITQRQRLSQTQKPRNQKGIVNPTKIRKKERKKKERKKEAERFAEGAERCQRG
jgi:hypothetical protein